MLPLHSKLSRTFLEDILDVGFGGGRGATIAKMAITASVLLAIASGYTTWLGVKQYIPDGAGFFALLATLGIQGLLVATSWRIGQTFSETRLYPSLKIIYIATLLTSVFFSYSALLDNIYAKSERVGEQLRRSRREANLILKGVRRDLQKQQVTTADQALKQLDDLQKKVSASLGPALLPLRQQATSVHAEYERRHDRAEREQKYGITPTIQGMSRAGNGRLSQRYIEDAQSYYFVRLYPLDKRLKEAEASVGKVASAYQTLTSSRLELTRARFSAYISAAQDAANTLGVTVPQLSDDDASSLSVAINNADVVNGWLNEVSINASKVPTYTLSQLREALSKLVAQVPVGNADTFIERASRIGEGQGASAHPFVLATSELREGNPLAMGALIVAFTIDGLVLFCGLMMGRPQSYLWLKDSSQLDEVADEALQTILSLNLSRAGSVKRPYIRRILEILRRVESDVKLAKEGFPGVISREAIEHLKFAQEMGVFVAMNLAVTNADGERIALSTRLLLWMAQQVVAADATSSLSSDISSSL